jgi:hypothetical protein
MLDLSHIPNSQQDVQIFYANGSAWQTWRKPKKCTYVYIMCIGGAGGGTGGFISSVYAPGGASAGISRALYNAQQLSDILYVQVGLGGAGGANANSGSPGTRSWVSLQPSSAVAQILIQGSGGSAAAGGTNTGLNSAGESAITQGTVTFLTLSNFIGTAGVTSVASASLSTPPNITPFSSQLLTQGGGGGGNGPTSGASILSTTISPLISGGLSSGSGNGGDGANGITSYKPFYSLGGSGGGNSQSGGNGGNGGNGGIGSGGGGGGGGASGFIGGTGGKGGDGLVIIISF